MSYTAKNLEEIAAMFDDRAEAAYALAPEAQGGLVSKLIEASTWRCAAHILRRTTLTEPCHMESDAYTARRNA